MPDQMAQAMFKAFNEKSIEDNGYWKVIAVDNFARETVADVLIEEMITKERAEELVDKLNATVHENSSYWHQVVKQDYILSRGMLDFM